MQLFKTLNSKKEIKADPFIVMNKEELNDTAKVEIWVSDFKDAGDDFCEWRFFEKNATKPFNVIRKNGY